MPEQRLPRTQCVACLLKWPSSPLPTIRAANLRMHRSQGLDALFFLLSSNHLTYFFDPRTVLTLGSLARKTLAPWEFRQVRLFRHRRRQLRKPR